mmetsp:Transcript_15516/g.25852  ORF Transcript_15516/g.25852 Transcript_15516/m.25852 type:complete len:239 (+) Transcript_15516:90-806(+)
MPIARVVCDRSYCSNHARVHLRFRSLLFPSFGPLPTSRPQCPRRPQITGVVVVVVQHVHGTLGILVVGQDAVGAKFHHLRRTHVVNVLVHLAIAGGDASVGAVLLRVLLGELLVAPELHGVDDEVGGRRTTTTATAAQLVGEEGVGGLGIREWFQILLVFGREFGLPLLQLADADELAVDQVGDAILQVERRGGRLGLGLGRGRSGSNAGAHLVGWRRRTKRRNDGGGVGGTEQEKHR